MILPFSTEGAKLGRAETPDDQEVIRATQRTKETAPETLAIELRKALSKVKQVPWVSVGDRQELRSAVIIEGEFTSFDTAYRGGNTLFCG